MFEDIVVHVNETRLCYFTEQVGDVFKLDDAVFAVTSDPGETPSTVSSWLFASVAGASSHILSSSPASNFPHCYSEELSMALSS